MQKQTVYIESSVISYLTAFPSRDIIVSANQQITYEWWQLSKGSFDCYISDVVIDEISLGDELAAKKRLEVVVDIDLLELNQEIAALSTIYLNLFNIPKKSQLDALHLAIAVWHRIDFLLSWNCKHIANAFVNKKLQEYNHKNNLYIPILCTPIELMESNYE